MPSHRYVRGLTAGLLALTTGLFGSCGSVIGDSQTVILVHVKGRPSDTISLYATARLGDVSAMSGSDIAAPYPLDYFSLKLPGSISGRLTLDVSALGSDQCKAATGTVTVDLSAGRGQEVTVTLNALSPRLCSLIIDQSGEGNVTVTPQGTSCGTNCYDYNQGATTVLKFNATGKSYGAQAYVSSGGICDGYNDCSINMAKRVRADVKFQPRLRQSSWCWYNPLPQGNALSGMWGSSASDIWAVGDFGTAMHYNGQTWSLINANTTKHLHGVYAPAAGSAVVVGDAGLVIRWNGTAFVSEPSGTVANIKSVWGTAANNLFAVGDGGTIIRNAGNGWTPMASGTTNNLYRVHGSAADNVWAVGSTGTVRNFSGTSWNTVTGPSTAPLADVWTSGQNDVWAVGGTTGGDCGVFRRDGAGWKTSNTCSTGITAVWGNSPLDVWAGSGNIKTVLRFVGTDLTKVLTPDILNPGSLKGYIPTYKAAWGVKEGEVYLATSDGNILRYTADPASPTAAGSTQLVGPLRSIYAKGSAEFAVATGTGTTEYLLFGDGTSFSSDGRKISAVVSPPAALTALYDGWTAPTGELIVGGPLGNVYKYSPSTATWTSLKAATVTTSVYAVGGVSAMDFYVGSSSGNVYRYLNNVLPTSALNGTPYPGAIQSIWARTASEVWAVGGMGSVIKYTGTGSPSVLTVPAGITNLYAVHGPAAPSTHVWVVGAGGLIMRYDGTSWSKQLTTITTDLRSVVALSETDVWMAGDAGVLLHWDGTGIKQVPGPFGLHNLSKIHSPAPNDLWLVGDGNTVWRYMP